MTQGDDRDPIAGLRLMVCVRAIDAAAADGIICRHDPVAPASCTNTALVVRKALSRTNNSCDFGTGRPDERLMVPCTRGSIA